MPIRDAAEVNPDDAESIMAAVGRIKWWHRIDLGHGIVTPGLKDTAAELKLWKFPPDFFKEKNVLDIGAWDGFYSFHAERQGAKSVTAMDHYIWLGRSWASKAGFDLAKCALKSCVRDVTCDVMNLSPAAVGADNFDVVLFAGVFYHLPNPIPALENIRGVMKTGGRLFIETEIDRTHEKFPFMRLYHKTTLNKDSSNWWVPNKMAMEELLDAMGFRVDSSFVSPESAQRLILYCTKMTDEPVYVKKHG